MTHTPTPWVFEPGRDNMSGDHSLGSIMGDGVHIARIWNDQEYAEQDAQFIIKACNAHDELVKALKGVLHHNQALKKQYQLPDSLISQIERALTKAEKGV